MSIRASIRTIIMTTSMVIRTGMTNTVTIMGMKRMAMSERIPRNTDISMIMATRTRMIRTLTATITVIRIPTMPVTPTTIHRASKTRPTRQSSISAACRTCAVS